MKMRSFAYVTNGTRIRMVSGKYCISILVFDTHWKTSTRLSNYPIGSVNMLHYIWSRAADDRIVQYSLTWTNCTVLNDWFVQSYMIELYSLTWSIDLGIVPQQVDIARYYFDMWRRIARIEKTNFIGCVDDPQPEPRLRRFFRAKKETKTIINKQD